MMSTFDDSTMLVAFLLGSRGAGGKYFIDLFGKVHGNISVAS